MTTEREKSRTRIKILSAWRQHSTPTTYILKYLLKNSHHLLQLLPRSHAQEENTEAQFHQTSAAIHQESLDHNYHNKDSVKLEIALLI